jgi:hypothetical protein
MKSLFGGGKGLRNYEISQSHFVDFILLVKHKNEEILLLSELGLIGAILELIIGYFRFCKISKKDIQMLEGINKAYRQSLKEGVAIKEAVDVLKKTMDLGETLEAKLRFDAVDREDFQKHWRGMIREILQSHEIMIVDIWDGGCRFDNKDSLRDFPYKNGKAYEAFENISKQAKNKKFS